MDMLKIAILCGGPSLERGISLNSARSFLDHVKPLAVELTVFYLDLHQKPYLLTPGQLYSNTPADFDFKLKDPLTQASWISLLKQMDLVFPLIHGPYGEDGTLQALLEEHAIPFVGSKSHACRLAFDKHAAKSHLQKHHFATLPYHFVGSGSLDAFWKKECKKGAVVKPTRSGSSIGVRKVNRLDEAQQAIHALQDEGFSDLLVEPICRGIEFTICVLENSRGQAVSLIPLEIDLGSDPAAILDYRRKYLPSAKTRYYCPPRFSTSLIQEIRREAERLFHAFSLRHFARIDGWIDEEGRVLFSDLNPISGMEQNSFIFQQASRVGLSHTDLLRLILEAALNRSVPSRPSKKGTSPVFVLMGGTTSERHVSLMSGTNVWLKLLHSETYHPLPFLLDQDETVWQLPYPYTLHHTTDEIVERCLAAKDFLPLAQEVREGLGLKPLDRLPRPRRLNLSQLLDEAKEQKAFLFLGLHGGIGEDGTLQKRLEEKGLSFNGSSSKTSMLCMDKALTAQKIASLKDPFVLPMQQLSFAPSEDPSFIWKKATALFHTHDLLAKPQSDGCSTGVVRLSSQNELTHYLALLARCFPIPPHTFRYQVTPVELPVHPPASLLLEPFIHTDKIEIDGKKLRHQKISGWVEMTIVVLEKSKRYTALPPSITIAESHVLTLEEKFQGGTGINITPPPPEILSSKALFQVQKGAETAARALGIGNYARLDLFVELETGRIRVLEANTLPALTPSTVLYHQALTQDLSPEQFLHQLIDSVC